ncbi:anaphase-promoting complex subunit 1 [Schistosoma bovis]|uniref:Anaphase-promoting complex subunit 1 n=1 Tax=Schistosoma bovis TaxID=6184 RepID=A0A430QIF2_SCHBO|nr:anaphase-promoting complex subunit 1 [Schistosoma bovis]
MSDTMISAKSVVDVFPLGCQYLLEFCHKDRIHNGSSTLSGDQPHVNENIPGRIQEGLSIFESERMTFIDDSGEQYTVRIPCRIREVWALNTLVLLERQPNNYEVRSDNPNTTPTSSCALFSMFSLTHPLDEAAPVILKVPLPNGGFGIGFVSDVHLKIIGVIAPLNMVITYHSLTRLHSVWLLEKASSHDYIYLYQMDPDGRASVATHALTGLVYQPESVKHVKSFDKDLSTFDEHSVRCSLNSTICLSPFAASLSRLTRTEKQSFRLNHSGNRRSPGQSLDYIYLYQMDPDGRASVATHALTGLVYQPESVKHVKSFDKDLSTFDEHSVRCSLNSTICLSPFAASLSRLTRTEKQSFRLNHSGNRRSPGQSLVCFIFHATVDRNSSTRLNIYSSNLHETPVRTEKLYTIDPDQVENLLDEPLLPKVCLRLVWSETPSARSHSTLTNTGFFSPLNNESSYKKENVSNFVPHVSDLPASGRFALLSRRLPNLPFPASRTESLIFNSPSTTKNKALCGNLCNSSQAVPKYNNVTLPLQKSGPVKSRAFLAVDIISTSWICFLTGSSIFDCRQSRLACLRINDNYLDCKQLEDFPTVFGDLVYLRACDAVYVPYSRITICLEPGVGIVLYSGIKKICLLGLSPPPLLSMYLGVGGPQTVKSRLRHAASIVEVPFIVRPDLLNTERWHQNTVHSVLSKCISVMTSNQMLIDQSCTVSSGSISNNNTFCFSELSSDLINIKELHTKQGNDHLCETNHSNIDTENCSEINASNNQSAVKSMERISLCDPAGNSFTIANQSKATGVDKSANSVDSNQFLRVYLPTTAENEMVQRCLTSLNRCLPEDASLMLFARWYVISNAPGTKSSYKFQEPETSYCDDTGDLGTNCFDGPGEWNRFANFILSASGFSFYHRHTGNIVSSECQNNVGGIFRSSKRRRPGPEESSELDWNNLIDLLDLGYDNELVHPSLFLPKSINSLFTKMDFEKNLAFSDQKQSVYLSYVRDDPDSRIVLSYLPTILFAFHLTYEEAKLNSILQDKVKHLAELNFIISSILNLPAYTTFYENEYPSLCNLSLVTEVKFPTKDLRWPDKISFDIAPCLLTWIIRQLESVFYGGTSVRINPYPYLTGVNDLATALAGVIVSALSTDKLEVLKSSDSKSAVQYLLEFWSDHIFTWKTFVKSSGSVYECASRKRDDFPIFNDEEVKHWLQNAGPYACSYVETLLTCVTLSGSKFSHENESTGLPISAQHLALLFLSRLESSSTVFYGVLSRRLRVLPPGLSMVLRIFLSRCRLHPPPNCDPHVYSLMGRTDLAKQAHMLNHQENSIFDSVFNCSNSVSTSSEPISLCKVLSVPSSVGESSSWSIGERWSNLVLPLRDIDSLSSNVAVSSHALLYHIENNPCCQASFKDDLRLREAYRLLQSFSHIRLPRLNSEDPVSTSPNNASGSDLNARLTEARFEMHLAAAGIRVWASVIGRGMLTFGILTGSKVPTQLRVPPICLRGRAISPSSGRRVLVDLAREPLGPANTNVGANRTGTAEAIASGLDIAGGSGDRLRTTGVQSVDASNHPGNSVALAIASSLASCGAGASLRTVSLGLKRMTPSNNLLNNYASSNISTTATNSASSTASLLSTANIQQAPGVLAAKHWPDFHNGVAVGLSISPHASIDATWILYNCRAAGLTSTNNSRNNLRTNQDSTSSQDTSSPEQAGLLLGLGLNGHLNKITPYDIGEYLVRVHDLHNMAVLLGLCAGRRGTMDQSVLRLIAVHYRPLLPSNPLINVQLSVPNLCQAAAIFGLGLLYQGSAHRHITNLLINELGRSLSEDSHSDGAHLGLNADTDSQQTVSNASNNNPTNNTIGWTGAGGSGGFAGDSCELMALSAGLALGLVLLQVLLGLNDESLASNKVVTPARHIRGDTPCGLSDLQWAEKLRAYMTSGPRSTNSAVAENQQFTVHFSCDLHERCLPIQRAKGRGAPHRLVDHSRRPHQTTVEPVSPQNNLSDSSTRGASLSSSAFRTPSLLLHSDYSTEPLVDPERFLTNDHLHNSMDVRGISSSSRQPSSRRRSLSNTGPATSPTLTNGPNRISSTVSDLAGRLDECSTKTIWKNPQIRDLHCYNADVSAPGAMMALGMAYLGSGNSTVSSWLLPPSSLRQLELIRPDLLLFQALAYGLVNWNSIEPTQEWIDSYIPEQLFERLSESIRPRPKLHSPSVSDIRATLGQADLSSEDDVENRCPDQIFSDSLYHAYGRSAYNRGRRSTLNNARGRPVRRSRRYDIRQWSEEESSVNNIKAVPGKSECFDQFGLQNKDSVDIEAISLAYLNILVGCALAMGLRYAGTSNSNAANTLYSLARSLLNDSWWPPSYFAVKSPSQNKQSDSEQIKTSLPKSTLLQSAAQCLLALAMILAGSGNLTVLKIVRQLRAIHLFNSKPDTLSSGPINNTASDSLYHTVTAAAARAAATTQTVSTSSTGASVSGPVSVASVFGAALGPSYGLQMLLANTVGLLFLGGGRSNKNNICNNNTNTNNALRHFYALATIPRRVCAVDVDTGRVVLSNFEAKLRESDVIVSSNDTFVFPSDVLDNIAWLEINHNSDKYWPTVFYHGTNNWDMFRMTFYKAGYIFVKQRDEGEELNVLQSWLEECLKQWLDLCILKQLKLLVTFLKRFSSTNKLTISNGHERTGNSSRLLSSCSDLGRLLAARVTQHFIKHKDELSVGLKNYYFDVSNVTTTANQHNTFQSRLVKAFRMWFSLPDHTILLPHLPKVLSLKLINRNAIIKPTKISVPSITGQKIRFIYYCNLLGVDGKYSVIISE